MSAICDVSVIVPVHSPGEYFADFLNSLASQDTDLNWEVILSVNSIISDDAHALIHAFQSSHPNLRVIDSASVVGAAHARNAGAKIASSPFLLFCDSDDVADALWVHMMVRRLRRSAGYVAGRLLFDEINEPGLVALRHTHQSSSVPEFLGIPYVVSANIGVSRAIFEELGGFDETFGSLAGEDVDFGVKAWFRGLRPEFEPQAGIHYRLRAHGPGSIQQARNYGAVASRIFDRYPNLDRSQSSVSSDIRAMYRLAKRIFKAVVRSGPSEATKFTWTFHYQWGSVVSRASSFDYWRWRVPTEGRGIGRRAWRDRAKRLSVLLGNASAVSRETEVNPWAEMERFAASWPAVERHRLGGGLLSDVDAEIRCVRNGVTWNLNPSMDQIVLDLMHSGEYSAVEMEAVSQFVRSKHPSRIWMVNAGANIGSTVVPFALDAWHALAIEPAAQAHSLLTKNVIDNGLEGRVKIVKRAIGAFTGEIDMGVGSNLSMSQVLGGYTLASVTTTGDISMHVERVDCDRLDNIVRAEAIDPTEVGLVWSDTEGCESEVILSGSTLWTAGAYLWVEIYPWSIRRHSTITEFVSSASNFFGGFTWLDNGRLLDIRPTDALREFIDGVGYERSDFRNILLVPRVSEVLSAG